MRFPILLLFIITMIFSCNKEKEVVPTLMIPKRITYGNFEPVKTFNIDLDNISQIMKLESNDEIILITSGISRVNEILFLDALSNEALSKYEYIYLDNNDPYNEVFLINSYENSNLDFIGRTEVTLDSGMVKTIRYYNQDIVLTKRKEFSWINDVYEIKEYDANYSLLSITELTYNYLHDFVLVPPFYSNPWLTDLFGGYSSKLFLSSSVLESKSINYLNGIIENYDYEYIYLENHQISKILINDEVYISIEY